MTSNTSLNVLRRSAVSLPKPKLVLRGVEPNDHEWLVSLHNDPLVLRNLTDPTPITFESHMKWWDSIKDNAKELRLIFTVNNERVGFTKFYEINFANRNCDLGAELHKDWRGKGLAKPMWKVMLEYCFNVLHLHRVGLTTAEYNDIARKVYANLGFIEEGRFVQSLYRDGKYYDQILMFMTEDMWVKNNVA